MSVAKDYFDTPARSAFRKSFKARSWNALFILKPDFVDERK